MAALFGAPERGSRGGGGGGGVAATITLIARAGNVDDGGPTTELGRLSSKSNHSHSLILLGEHSNDSIMHHLNHLSNITSPPELDSSNNHHGYNSTIADMTTRHIRQAGPFQQQEQLEAFTWLELLLVAVLIGLILVSIVGNCLVCVAIFTDRRLRKLGNAFIVSLAIADLFVSCLVMTFALCNDLMNTWIFGDWFCDLWISFDIMCCTASILNLCAISLDRFIHIKDCLLYNQWMTKRVALGAVLVIWFISALVSIVPINLGWHRPHHFGGSRALHRRHLAAWSMADAANDDHLQLESTGTFISNVAENTNDLDEDDDGLYATRGNREGGGEERIFGKLNYKWPANGPPQSTKEIIKLAQANDLVANSTPAAHQLQHERRPLGAGNGPSSWQRDDEQPRRETKSASLGAPSGHSKWAPPGWTEVRTSGADSQAHRKDNHRRPIGEDEYEQDDKFLMNSQVEVTRRPLLSPPTPPTPPTPRQPSDDDDVARNNINIRAPSEATSTSKLSEYIGQLKRPTTGRQQEQQQQQFNQVELNPTSRQPGSEAHQTDVPLAATQTGETQIKVAEKHQGDLRRRLQQRRRRRQTRPSDWPDESSSPGASRGSPEAGKPGTADQPPPQCMLILTPTYAVVSSTISFYIPCLIMLGLYSKLFACARRHVKNIRAMARAPAPLPLPARSSSSTPSVVGSVAARPEAGVGVQSSGGGGGGGGDNNHNHNDNDSDKQPANRADEQTGEQHKSASGRTQDDCQRDDKSNQRPQVAWPRRACRTWIKFGRLKGRGKSGGGGDHKDDVAAKKDTKAKDEKANNTTMLMLMTPNQQMGAQSEQPADQCKANKADEQEPFLAEGGQDQLTLNSLTADSLSLSRQVTCNSARSITFRLNLAGLTSKHREQQQSSHSLATITMTNQQQQQQQQQQEKSTQTHKAAITLGIIMGTFLFCWVPFFCLNIIKAFCVDCIPSSMFRFFTWLGYANSALNPIIYGIHNSEFRNAFNRIFFKHLSLKNGRQYLNRRFSYDVRPHHHHHHQQRQQHQNNPKNSSTSLTTNQNNNNNKSRQPQTPTSNQLEGTTSRPLMMEE